MKNLLILIFMILMISCGKNGTIDCLDGCLEGKKVVKVADPIELPLNLSVQSTSAKIRMGSSETAIRDVVDLELEVIEGKFLMTFNREMHYTSQVKWTMTCEVSGDAMEINAEIKLTPKTTSCVKSTDSDNLSNTQHYSAGRTSFSHQVVINSNPLLCDMVMTYCNY